MLRQDEPKQTNYTGVLKNPVLIISVVVFLALYVFGMLQSDEDIKAYLSVPLFALTPIIVGILIIREATKKK